MLWIYEQCSIGWQTWLSSQNWWWRAKATRHNLSEAATINTWKLIVTKKNILEVIFQIIRIFFFVFVYQESSVAEVENEISRDILDISNTTTRIRQLQDIMENLNDEIHQKNGTISKIEGEIVKRNAIIERKQSTIDQYNKRIDQMRSKDGVCDESSMYKLV